MTKKYFNLISFQVEPIQDALIEIPTQTQATVVSTKNPYVSKQTLEQATMMIARTMLEENPLLTPDNITDTITIFPVGVSSLGHMTDEEWDSEGTSQE